MTAATPTVSVARLTGTRAARRRTWTDRIMRTVAAIATISCVIPLAAVLIYVTLNGLAALNLDLLTKPPRPQGIGGGAVTAILGSIQMVALATIMAIPFGVLAGVYVSEFSSARTARSIRFSADVLVGVPSILIGIFVFTFLVLPFKQYNAFAGSVALAVIMVPVIMRTTEEILKLVPVALREASLSLGIPTWRTVLSVVLRTGLPGILTGIMLAVARAAGETAPLLFTALGQPPRQCRRLLQADGRAAPCSSTRTLASPTSCRTSRPGAQRSCCCCSCSPSTSSCERARPGSGCSEGRRTDDDRSPRHPG